jgi:antibiotic biosynthesis monooxygenase (ABM) superfamily enzyme
VRLWIAVALLIGSVLFPLGVLLQTAVSGPIPSALAIAGCVLVTAALALTIAGFVRRGPSDVPQSASVKTLES